MMFHSLLSAADLSSGTTRLRANVGLRRRQGLGSAISERESNVWNLLRVILLAQVVMGHLAAIAMPTLAELHDYATPQNRFVLAYRLVTRFGPQAAFLFVFISGYFVGGPLLSQAFDKQPLCWRDFYHRRVARIAPTLILGVGLGAAIDGLAVSAFGVGDAYRQLGAYDFTATMTSDNLLASLLCLQPTFAKAFGSNGPLWTLGDIVQFYAAGFWLCQGIARRDTRRLAAAGTLFILCATLAPEWALLFVCWLLGAASRLYSLSADVSRKAITLAAIAVLAANRLPTLASIVACCVAGMALAFWVHDCRLDISAAFVGMTKRVAALSYSAYVVHYPVAFALFATLFGQRLTSLTATLAFVALALGAIVVAALAVEGVARRIPFLRRF
jgi:peptidoglycan/LPS O-acetylase OafA/YrhL